MAIVLQPRSDFRDVLANLFAQSDARRAEKQAREQAQANVDREFGLQQSEVEARKALYGKQGVAAEQEAAAKEFADLIAPFRERMVQAQREGNQGEMVRLATEIKAQPGYARFRERFNAMLSASGGGTATPLASEQATGSSWNYIRDLAKQAEGGSQDAQARAVAQEVATGRPVTPHQFEDQTQRQMPDFKAGQAVAPSSTYGQSLAISGKRAPSGGEKLDADTRVRTTGMQISAEAPLRKAQTEAAYASAESNRASAEKSRAEAKGGAAPPKPMSAEAAKTRAVATTLIPELKLLRDAMEKNHVRAVAGIVSGTDRNLSRLAQSAADKVGRLRSGGAINKQEEARFIGQIASWKDIPLARRRDITAAIDRYITEAESVKAGITPGSGKTVTRAELQRMGATEEEAAAEGYTVVY